MRQQMIILPHLNTKLRTSSDIEELRKKSLVLHQLKNNELLTDIHKQEMKHVDENIKYQELKLKRLQNRQQTDSKQDDVN